MTSFQITMLILTTVCAIGTCVGASCAIVSGWWTYRERCKAKEAQPRPSASAGVHSAPRQALDSSYPSRRYYRRCHEE